MSSDQTALAVAQAFIHAVETRDREAIARLLSEEARHVFPMAGGGSTGLGAVYVGKDEVLGYTYGLFDKFDSLVWVDKDWTASADGSRAFLEARSDGIATHSKAAYVNTYVIRFDVSGGQVTQFHEYAIAELFIALGTTPTEFEKRAIARAQSLS